MFITALIYYMLVADLHLLNVYKYNILHDLKLLWGVIRPYLDWKMLVVLLPVWSITHLWAYIGAVIGRGVFRAVCLGWIAFIYMPAVNENLVFTLPVSIWIYNKLFKKKSDQLEKMLQREKSSE